MIAPAAWLIIDITDCGAGNWLKESGGSFIAIKISFVGISLHENTVRVIACRCNFYNISGDIDGGFIHFNCDIATRGNRKRGGRLGRALFFGVNALKNGSAKKCNREYG